MKNFIFIVSLLVSTNCFAKWSANLGIGNPPSSTFGINFMYLWSNWAIEGGVGTSGTAGSSTIGSDLNFKYLFGSTFFRPYLQGGFAISANSGSVSAGSNPFAGVGFFLMGNPLYFYLSYIINTNSGFQWGLGYNF